MAEAWQVTTTIIIIYSLVMVGLGYVAWRRFRRTIEDYYLVSRTVGGLILFLTLAATYHSAFAFLTSVAVFSSSGVSFWIGSMLWTILAAVGGYVLGKRMYILAKKYGHITPADLLAHFFKSEALRFLTGILQALFIIGYIVVQSIGLGIVLSIGSGGKIPYEEASLLFMAVTIIYLIVGGNRAAFWTDAIQGVWMYIGIWAAGFYITYKYFGGVTPLFEQVRQHAPKLLTMNWSWDLTTSFVIAFSFGIILLPHLWLRYYSALDTRAIKIGSAGMAIYVSSFYLPAMLIGLGAAVLNVTGLNLGDVQLQPGFIKELVSTYGSRDAVMAHMIFVLTPAVFAGFLLAGAASAAMSTLDSMLAATSMVLTRDIYQRFLKRNATERELIAVGRALVLIWGLLGWYFAVKKPGLIFDIVAIAAAGGLQFLVPVLQVVFPKRRLLDANGVLAGLIVGVIVTILFTNRFGVHEALGLPGYHPAEAGVIGLIVNAIVALIVSSAAKRETLAQEYSETLAQAESK